MKTTKRFENAVTKLYNAFHDGTLDSFDCSHCAVGNMCDNTDDWATARVSFDSEWDYRKNSAIMAASKTGYSLFELSKVEKIFVEIVPFHLRENKETQFKGLCAVVEYLCELDNIPNIMDYTSLFETENNKPIKELQF